MADTQNVIYAQTYGRNIMALAQQKTSKLYPVVYKKPNVDGKTFFQDRIGEWSMAQKTGRASATPLKDPAFSRRMAVMQDFNDARPLDKEDDIKIISDPKSAMTLSAGKSIGRRYDDTIISALTSTAAATGETGSGSASMLSDHLILDGSTNLTLAKILEAKRLMDDNDVEPEDRVLVVSPAGLEALLNLEKLTSADYNTVKALVRGEIDTYLGFRFITSTRLPISGNVRQCIAFQKYGLCFGEGTSPQIRTDERRDLSYTWQVYYSVHIGAVRLEEERVVQIAIDESA
jgi:phage gp36-like protein